MPCTFSSQKAGGIHVCIRKSITNILTEGTLSLLSALVRHIQKAGSRSGLLSTKMDIQKWLQGRTTKMVNAPEHLSCKDKMEEMGLFNVEKRSLGDHIDLMGTKVEPGTF